MGLGKARRWLAQVVVLQSRTPLSAYLILLVFSGIELTHNYFQIFFAKQVRYCDGDIFDGFDAENHLFFQLNVVMFLNTQDDAEF